MTFGRTLQELTRLCGVKRCNLADALGYDPSYISRWINGVKHPSLRSNDALPAQIAAYLTANAAPDVRAPVPAAPVPGSARQALRADYRRLSAMPSACPKEEYHRFYLLEQSRGKSYSPQ